MITDQNILSFLQSQTVVNIATCENNVPYSASCFYAYSDKYNSLIFKSNIETKHISQGLKNNDVAGTIIPDKSDFTKIKGIQFSGIFTMPTDKLLSEANRTYYAKYPFALAMKGNIWIIKLTRIKLTDNTLGFGVKLHWESDKLKEML